MPTNPEDLVAAAMQRYNAMSPAEQAAMWQAQRRSWVVGEIMFEHPDWTREFVEALYAKVTHE